MYLWFILHPPLNSASQPFNRLRLSEIVRRGFSLLTDNVKCRYTWANMGLPIIKFKVWERGYVWLQTMNENWILWDIFLRKPNFTYFRPTKFSTIYCRCLHIWWLASSDLRHSLSGLPVNRKHFDLWMP